MGDSRLSQGPRSKAIDAVIVPRQTTGTLCPRSCLPGRKNVYVEKALSVSIAEGR